jgi:dGTPase
VYSSVSSRTEAKKARLVVRRLYKYLNEHTDRLPAEYQSGDRDIARKVVDYIAGMTDQYATNLAKELALFASGQ